jgi:hypothetical protein
LNSSSPCSTTPLPWTAPDVRRDRRPDATRTGRTAPAAPRPAELGGRTQEAREELGLLVREYRQSVLVWMSQAMRAAGPLAFSNMPPAQRNPFRSVGTAGSHLTAAGELACAIDLAETQSKARTASSEALVTTHDNPVVEHWRLAARHSTGRARHVGGVRGSDDREPGAGTRRRHRRVDPGDRRTRPALQEHPRLGAAGTERTTRLGIPRRSPRRRPRTTRLHRRPPRLAPQDQDSRTRSGPGSSASCKPSTTA